MFIGHYGVAFAAAARVRKPRLGWFFLAVQGLDLLFMAFVLTGVEHMRLVPGYTAVNAYVLEDVALSHGLVAAAAWSLAAGLVGRVAGLRPAAAVVLGLAVGSHFALDLPMHTPDLPLLGGGSPKLGLGLWNHVGLTIAAERVVLLGGLALYRRRGASGPRLAVFAVALVAMTIATPFLPVPPSPAAFAIEALAGYLGLAAWAGWVDRGIRTRT
jgi:hypothetical protein